MTFIDNNGCDDRKAGGAKRCFRFLAVFLAALMLLSLAEPLQAFAVAKPSITKQPTDREVTQGKKAVFRVRAKGAGLKYQWYIKLEGGSWKKLAVASAKTAKLRLTAKAKHDGAQIRCKVTNKGGSVYSETVTLTVTKANKTKIKLNSKWKYADEAVIHSGYAVLYRATKNRKEIVVGVNAGHGTKGGGSAKTWSHPDHSVKVTGGTTGAGAYKAYAVSSGMEFRDGTPEAVVTLKVAKELRTLLLAAGYDVLMLRDGEDVQLDNVARTVIANNKADCHIAIHFDGDGLSYDKGAYYLSVPNALKRMKPVSAHWKQHEALGKALIRGLRKNGIKIWDENPLDMDLTQTSYSTVPSVVIELGNERSKHTAAACKELARGLLAGINLYFKDK